MKLLLTRKTHTTRSTIGELAVDGKFQCFVLEDPVRPAKIKGITAIPAGTYRVVITWSAKFRQRMPLLEDVPGFEGIRIHPGNTPEHTEGCLLVGKTKATDSIGTSRDAYRELFSLLDAELATGRQITLRIVDGGVSPFVKPPVVQRADAGATFLVTADPLRIRSAADTADAANILGRLPYGHLVSATGGKAPADWLEVETSLDGTDLRGFVATEFLEAVPKAVVVAEPATPVPEAWFRVNSPTLNLRSEAAVLTDETILAALPRNHLVRKIAETPVALWWRVAAVVHGKPLEGFVNSSLLSAEGPDAPESPLPLRPGEVALSEKALQLILDFEGMDRPWIWPGQMSGISLGRGYDLGYHTHDEFKGDWGKHLADQHLSRLAGAIGKRGAAAKAIAAGFRGIAITTAAADAVFMSSTVPKIRLWALKTFPGITALPLDAQGALTSLVYNRGTDMTGDRRLEMRQVRGIVADASLTVAAKLSRIAAALRAMKRHWPKTDRQSGHPGIRRRREAEAALVENSWLPPEPAPDPLSFPAGTTRMRRARKPR